MYMDISCNKYINFLTCFYKKHLNLVSGLYLTRSTKWGAPVDSQGKCNNHTCCRCLKYFNTIFFDISHTNYFCLSPLMNNQIYRGLPDPLYGGSMCGKNAWYFWG